MFALFPEILHLTEKGDPEALALLVRKYFGENQMYAPRLRVGDFYRNAGIDLKFEEIPGYARLEAWDNKGQYVVQCRINPKFPNPREQNYALAHLLGHVFFDLHPKMANGELQRSVFEEKVSPAERMVRGSERLPKGEALADAFALGLLLPRGMLKKAASTLSTIEDTAAFFHVDVLVLIRRLEQLGMIAPSDEDEFVPEVESDTSRRAGARPGKAADVRTVEPTVGKGSRGRGEVLSTAESKTSLMDETMQAMANARQNLPSSHPQSSAQQETKAEQRNPWADNPDDPWFDPSDVVPDAAAQSPAGTGVRAAPANPATDLGSVVKNARAAAVQNARAANAAQNPSPAAGQNPASQNPRATGQNPAAQASPAAGQNQRTNAGQSPSAQNSPAAGQNQRAAATNNQAAARGSAGQDPATRAQNSAPQNPRGGQELRTSASESSQNQRAPSGQNPSAGPRAEAPQKTPGAAPGNVPVKPSDQSSMTRVARNVAALSYRREDQRSTEDTEEPEPKNKGLDRIRQLAKKIDKSVDV